MAISVGQRLRSATATVRRAARAHRRRARSRSGLGRLTTAIVCLVAGLLVAVSAVHARGSDLRPARNTDLVSLVQDQSRRNGELADRLAQIRSEVEQLSADTVDNATLDSADARLRVAAGLTAVTGPAVAVTLDDAPDSVAPEGVDADLLVVHQQDIQAVVNALWSGGAEAMTIQGQRVIATTGIKCVGNTVVLHGVPYAPPYVIRALGEPGRLRAALSDAPPLQIYRQYVDAYGLRYSEQTLARADFPAYDRSFDLVHASGAR